MEKEANTVICKVYTVFAFLFMEDSNYACIKYKLIRLLENKMEHLEAHLAILSLIHENKEYLKKAEDYIQTK